LLSPVIDTVITPSELASSFRSSDANAEGSGVLELHRKPQVTTPFVLTDTEIRDGLREYLMQPLLD
jgi:hypothetical protein